MADHDREQDRLLREALLVDAGAVERAVARASRMARAGRDRRAASTPLPSGNSRSGGSSLRGAGSKPLFDRSGVGRRLAAGLVAAIGLGVGWWLSASSPRAVPSSFLITNEGAVFALRDASGAARLLSGVTLAGGEPSRTGIAMLVFHGGVR